MSRLTVEDQLAKLEDELGELKIFVEANEEEIDMTVAEIEKRLKYLERFNADGR